MIAVNDIVPMLTEAQYNYYREYMDVAARPIFSMIAGIKLGAGRRFTITPDGPLVDERFLFTPEEQQQLDVLRELLQTIRDLAMNQAMGLYGPPRRP